MSFNEFSIFPRVVTQKCCHHFMWFAWFYRFNRYLPNVICKVWEVCQGNMVVQAQLSSSAFNILHQSFIFTFYWSVHMYSSEHTAIIVMVISVFNFSEFESFWTFEKFNFSQNWAFFWTQFWVPNDVTLNSCAILQKSPMYLLNIGGKAGDCPTLQDFNLVAPIMPLIINCFRGWG